MTGTIRWFDEIKGFGLIRADDGRDILVHHSLVRSRRSFRDGTRVKLEVVMRQGRAWASRVACEPEAHGSSERLNSVAEEADHEPR